jgi:hemerythrin superfamily protein
MFKTTNKVLSNDHAELDALLEEIFAALDTGDTRHSFQRLDLFWARLAMHIRAEHLHLFPKILAAVEERKTTGENGQCLPAPEKARMFIEELRADHDFFMRELASAVKQMRRLPDSNEQTASQILLDTRKKLAAIKRRLERHNRIEESQIYQWADEILNLSERAALDHKIKEELENMPPRFAYSSTELL